MRQGKTISPGERDTLIEQARGQPTLPSPTKLVGNFAKAVVRHVKNGLKLVNVSVYTDRINTCNPCPMRSKNRCTHEECGCFIDKKAWWDSEKCPLEKWE